MAQRAASGGVGSGAPALDPTSGATRSGDSSRPLAVGLFGGSFDPIHTGHLHVARAARDAFGLERVLFVPARRPPHKPGRELASGRHRLAMVRLAIEGERGFEASALELEREGPSYTVDTLYELARDLDAAERASDVPRAIALHLILGSDNLPDLPRWHRADEILRLAQPIVVLRAEDPIPGDEWFDALPPEQAERIRAGLVRLPPAPGRSTELREALRAGEDDSELLPAPVRAYVREHGLYRPSEGE